MRAQLPHRMCLIVAAPQRRLGGGHVWSCDKVWPEVKKRLKGIAAVARAA
jgi:hypothetical protein